MKKKIFLSIVVVWAFTSWAAAEPDNPRETPVVKVVEPHGLTPVVPLFSSLRDVCPPRRFAAEAAGRGAATSRPERHSSTPLQTWRSVGGVKENAPAVAAAGVRTEKTDHSLIIHLPKK